MNHISHICHIMEYLPQLFLAHSDFSLTPLTLNIKDNTKDFSLNHKNFYYIYMYVNSVLIVKNSNEYQTRMHSSRMRTGRSYTVCRSLLPGGGLHAGGWCLWSRGVLHAGGCLWSGGFSMLGGGGGVWSGGLLLARPPL